MSLSLCDALGNYPTTETETETSLREKIRASEEELRGFNDRLRIMIEGRDYTSSSANSRPPEVGGSGVWRGKHVRFSETKATKRAKKPDKDWEINILNPDNPQGAEYKYYLGDADIAEGVVAYKDQPLPKELVIGATGKPVKERRLKAVRREVPFLSTDTCSACITWDRAGGSEVLRWAGIAGSFVMCCATKTEGGATYCDNHTKKAPKLGNFWEGNYKVDGMSYAKFLVEKCGKNAVGVGVDKDYCVGKGAKW